MAKRIGIVYCKKINESGCIGCAKCYKAINEREHAFAGQDVQLVFKTGCGDCPGLALPKLDVQMRVLEALKTGVDAIYFGTCVKKARGVMNCPMNVEGITAKIKELYKVPVEIGTHDY